MQVELVSRTCLHNLCDSWARVSVGGPCPKRKRRKRLYSDTTGLVLLIVSLLCLSNQHRQTSQKKHAWRVDQHKHRSRPYRTHQAVGPSVPL